MSVYYTCIILEDHNFSSVKQNKQDVIKMIQEITSCKGLSGDTYGMITFEIRNQHPNIFLPLGKFWDKILFFEEMDFNIKEVK